MSRHDRRASQARFRAEAGGSLITWLVSVDAVLAIATLEKARSYFLSLLELPNIKRQCIACGTKLSRANVSGILLSMPALDAPAASVSACCTKCWENADIMTIESASARVLNTVVRGGRF